MKDLLSVPQKYAENRDSSPALRMTRRARYALDILGAADIFRIFAFTGPIPSLRTSLDQLGVDDLVQRRPVDSLW